MAFSDDCKTLAVIYDGAFVKVWDLPTGKERMTIDSEGNHCFDTLAFTRDGTKLALAHVAKDSETGKLLPTIWVWDLARNKKIWTLTGHEERVTVLAFTPDGKTLAACKSDSHSVKLWDVVKGEERNTLHGEDGRESLRITSLAFSADGSTLAAGCWGGLLVLWDPAAGKERARLEWDPRRDHDMCQVMFCPGGKTIAADRGFVGLFDLKSGKQITNGVDWLLEPPFTLSPDGAMVAGTRGSDKIVVRELPSRKRLTELHLPDPDAEVSYGYPEKIRALAFTPDGKTLVAGRGDNKVYFWDVPKSSR
jgi:WD40 repeat protein